MQTQVKTPEPVPTPDKLKARLDELKAMRDEIRVKIHLAGMDAKDAFQKIEPSVDKAELELEHLAKDAGVAVAHTLDKLTAGLKKIRAKLPK